MKYRCGELDDSTEYISEEDWGEDEEDDDFDDEDDEEDEED